MANEKRLIDVDKAKKDFNLHFGGVSHAVIANKILDEQPTVDAVSRGVVDQIRWERDVAIKQLEEHGIPFGGIAPDVVKVVRCKDCKKWGGVVYGGWCKHWSAPMNGITHFTSADDFCSNGERKDNGE